MPRWKIYYLGQKWLLIQKYAQDTHSRNNYTCEHNNKHNHSWRYTAQYENTKQNSWYDARHSLLLPTASSPGRNGGVYCLQRSRWRRLDSLTEPTTLSRPRPKLVSPDLLSVVKRISHGRNRQKLLSLLMWRMQ